MKAFWINYPIAAIAAAVKSTLGCLFLFFLGLSLGTAVAEVVADPSVIQWWDKGGSGAVLLFGDSLLMIGLACMAVWGFAYVIVLAWLLYRALHDEMGVLAMFLAVTALQTVVTVAVKLMTREISLYDSPELGLRITLVYTVYAFVFLLVWGVQRLGRGKSPPLKLPSRSSERGGS